MRNASPFYSTFNLPNGHIAVSDNIPVIGNGTGIGLDAGESVTSGRFSGVVHESNFGLCGYTMAYGMQTGGQTYYGTGGIATQRAIGLTKDVSKSGMVASITNTSFVNAIIKY